MVKVTDKTKARVRKAEEVARSLDRIRGFVVSGQASEADMETLGYEEVERIKTARDVMQLRDFAPPAELEVKQVGERTFRFVFSSEKPDRVNDIIRQGGWKLDDFRANPVSLWAHNGFSHPPIGRASKLNTNDSVAGFRATSGDIELAPAGISDLVDMIHALLESGFLRATSVGFMTLEIKRVDDEEERAKLGLGRFGLLITKARLKEISIVSIGMHQDALMRACDDALVTNASLREGAKELLKTVPMTERDYAQAVKELCTKRIPLPSWAEDKEVEIVGDGDGKQASEDSDVDPQEEEDMDAKAIGAFCDITRAFVEAIERADERNEQLATEIGKVAECVADLCDRLEVAGDVGDDGRKSDDPEDDSPVGDLSASLSALQGLADKARETVKKASRKASKPEDEEEAESEDSGKQ